MTVNDVITGALRRLGVIASGETPTGAEAADALTAFNAMCADYFDSIRQLTEYRLTQSLTLVNEDLNFVASGVALTITLPQEPREGQRFGVYDGAGSLATYPVTIAPNGRLIGGVSTLVLSTTGTAKQWFYRSDMGWVLIADKALTDDPYLPLHDGLTAMLAMRLADEYGAEPQPATVELARSTRSKLNRRFSRPLCVSVDDGVLSRSIQTARYGLELP